MALASYNEKRDFALTPEPKGGQRSSRTRALRFVVQKHQVSQLHYDSRLEHHGVLLSWAVPKGPSMRSSDKRLTVMVEDHPFDYRTFEGTIPEGNYGAGSVGVEGLYLASGTSDRRSSERAITRGLEKGHLSFVMNGEKLKGEYNLVKIHDAYDNSWLLIKQGDEYAVKTDVLKLDRSVPSERNLEEISKRVTSKRKASTASTVKKSARTSRSSSDAPRTVKPHDVKPMLATLRDVVPIGSWFYEIKWDGYRAIAETGAPIALYSRNGMSFQEKFAPIADALKRLTKGLVLDGEIVALDDEGRSRFQLLQNYQRTGDGRLAYYVFDLLYAEGRDLRNLPLRERLKCLGTLLLDDATVKISHHVARDGQKFFDAAVRKELEGIVAKRPDSHYEPGRRSPNWVKVKTLMGQEAVVGGYTEPQGSRVGIGALILGVYDEKGLTYIGHTGGGLDDDGLVEAKLVLSPLETKKSPFINPPKPNATVHWVEPEIVCEVKFAEWTKDGHMRQPIFVGWREDKSPRTVQREMPQSTPTKSRKKAIPTSPVTASTNDTEVTLSRHRVALSNLDKAYWPDDGITKRQLIEYYERMTPLMLPYLKDRPQSLHRFPNGITEKGFYQKDVGDQGPSWLKKVQIHSDSNDKEIQYLLCQNDATLIYMANLGCIEINPWSSTTKHLDKPDFVVIDLDPEEIGFDVVVDVANAVRGVLESLGVISHPKTSGATGLHIYVPLGAKYSYDQSKQFAEIVARTVNAQLPDVTSVLRSPAQRRHRVYLDFLQNNRGQTLAAPYSVRPQQGATVSAPLKWSEVSKRLRPSRFTMASMAKRIDKVGDLWVPVLGKGINLKSALDKLAESH